MGKINKYERKYKLTVTNNALVMNIILCWSVIILRGLKKYIKEKYFTRPNTLKSGSLFKSGNRERSLTYANLLERVQIFTTDTRGFVAFIYKNLTNSFG